jgi:hypothetical protein
LVERTAIQSNVIWDIGIVNYTDATAKQYLIDTYGWTIRGGVFDSSKMIVGSNHADALNASATQTTLKCCPYWQCSSLCYYKTCPLQVPQMTS